MKFLASPDTFNSEKNRHRTFSHELDEPRGLDQVLENTIHSVEDFVDDSVSTVSARSSNGSETSWAGNSKHFVPEHSKGPEAATFTVQRRQTTN